MTPRTSGMIMAAVPVAFAALAASFACTHVREAQGSGDAVSDVDVAASDSESADAVAPVSCAPSDGGAPRAWVPPHPRIAACASFEDIIELVHCTIAPPTTLPACESLADASSDESVRLRGCRDCLVSEADAATYGAIVHEDGMYRLNVNGCVAIQSDWTTSSSCAAKREAVASCARDGCRACFARGVSVFDTCVQSATRSVTCAQYDDPGCVDTLSVEHDLSPCTPENDFEFAARALGAFFCLADAGTEDAGAAEAGLDEAGLDEAGLDEAGLDAGAD